MDSLATEHGVACNAENRENPQETHSDPTKCSFPCHNSTNQTLEGLSQRDIELSSLHPIYRVQIATDVKANRTDRGFVPEADAHSVRIIANELGNANRAVHISTVIENRCAQALFNAQGKTEFRIENK